MMEIYRCKRLDFFLISAIIIDDPNFILIADKHYRV